MPCPLVNKYLDRFITFSLRLFLRRIDLAIVFCSMIRLQYFFFSFDKTVYVLYLDLLLWVFSSSRDPFIFWIVVGIFLKWRFSFWRWHYLFFCEKWTLCWVFLFHNFDFCFQWSDFVLMLFVEISQTNCFYLCFDCNGNSVMFV